MQPTIGRIVLVPMAPSVNNGADTAPAIISRVWNDTCINVRVMADNEDTPPLLTSVVQVPSVDGRSPNERVWAWPPRVGA